MPKLGYFLFLSIVLASSGCSNFQFPGVFKIDIHQGNMITQEMLDQLEPGMSRSQVLYVLGSPMLEDTFNAHRWDYYLSFRQGKEKPKIRHITLFFDGNQFSHYDGEIGEPIDFDKTKTDS